MGNLGGRDQGWKIYTAESKAMKNQRIMYKLVDHKQTAEEDPGCWEKFGTSPSLAMKG